MNNIIDNLPILLKDAYEGIEEIHNSPPEITLPLILGFASLGAQVSKTVNVGYDSAVNLSLYCLILASSGSKKSSTMNELSKGILEYEERNEIVYNIMLEDYERDLKAYAKDDSLPKPQHPVAYTHIESTLTLNGLFNHLDYSPAIGIITPEGSTLFEGHSFQERNGKREEITSNLNSLFSGEKMGKLTGVEKISLYGRKGMMLTMIQPDVITSLSCKVLHQQGFWPRFLITQSPPEKIKGHSFGKKINFIGVRQQKITPFVNKIIKLLDISTKNCVNYKVEIDSLTLTQQAKAIYSAQSKYVEKLAVTYSQDEEILPHVIRLQQLMIRVAGIMAVYEDMTVIDEKQMQLGIDIIKWFFERRLEISVDHSAPDLIIEISDKVVRWAIKKKVKTCTLTYLGQYGPSAYQKTKKENRMAVLEELDVSNRITVGKNGTLTNITFKEVE